MLPTIIKYKKLTWFTGRNGLFKSSGIKVSNTFEHNLHLIPITSKGVEGHCGIVIHKDNVMEFVNTIKDHFPDVFEKNSRIEAAGHYLCGDSDLSVEEMLELIDNYDGDPTDLIDDIDGVVVWEPLSGSLTVERFLMEV